jgi:hypothetical protein
MLAAGRCCALRCLCLNGGSQSKLLPPPESLVAMRVVTLCATSATARRPVVLLPRPLRARWPRRAGTPLSPAATTPPIGPILPPPYRPMAMIRKAASLPATSRSTLNRRAAHRASVQAAGKLIHVSQGRSAGCSVSSGSPSPRPVSTSAAQCDASSARTPTSRRVRPARAGTATPRRTPPGRGTPVSNPPAGPGRAARTRGRTPARRTGGDRARAGPTQRVPRLRGQRSLLTSVTAPSWDTEDGRQIQARRGGRRGDGADPTTTRGRAGLE